MCLPYTRTQKHTHTHPWKRVRTHTQLRVCICVQLIFFVKVIKECNWWTNDTSSSPDILWYFKFGRPFAFLRSFVWLVICWWGRQWQLCFRRLHLRVHVDRQTNTHTPHASWGDPFSQLCCAFSITMASVTHARIDILRYTYRSKQTATNSNRLIDMHRHAHIWIHTTRYTGTYTLSDIHKYWPI